MILLQFLTTLALGAFIGYLFGLLPGWKHTSKLWEKRAKRAYWLLREFSGADIDDTNIDKLVATISEQVRNGYSNASRLRAITEAYRHVASGDSQGLCLSSFLEGCQGDGVVMVVQKKRQKGRFVSEGKGKSRADLRALRFGRALKKAREEVAKLPSSAISRRTVAGRRETTAEARERMAKAIAQRETR